MHVAESVPGFHIWSDFFLSNNISYSEQFHRRFPNILIVVRKKFTEDVHYKKVSMSELSIVQHSKLFNRQDVIRFFAIIPNERNPFN